MSELRQPVQDIYIYIYVRSEASESKWRIVEVSIDNLGIDPLLCSKLAECCCMTMGPFRFFEKHHHQSITTVTTISPTANLSGTGCNGGHAVVTLHPWCTGQAGGQTATATATNREKAKICQGTWLPKLEIETYLALRSSWWVENSLDRKSPELNGTQGAFQWDGTLKNDIDFNQQILLNSSTNLHFLENSRCC